jgi:branched-chain amino acid transport system substrate-binding protein
MQWSRLFIGALFSFFLAYSCFAKDIKIGVLFSLTGDKAHLGETYRDSILMAQEGLGLTKHTYHFIFEDDRMEGKTAAAAVQKLINLDQVDAIISFSAVTGNIVAPLAEKAHIVHFSVTSDSKVANGKYNFIHWTPPQESARGFMKVLKEKNLSKVAVMALKNQDVSAVLDCLKQYGMNEVFRSSSSGGERDFRMVLQRAQKENPDVYLLALMPPELEICYKQMREIGIKTPATSIIAMGISNEPEIFEGCWYIDAADMPDDVMANFKKKYGHKITIGAGNACDIVNILVWAYEAFENPKADTVAEKLLTMRNFNGLLGKLNMDSEGIVFSRPTLKEIRHGKSVVIRRGL